MFEVSWMYSLYSIQMYTGYLRYVIYIYIFLYIYIITYIYICVCAVSFFLGLCCDDYSVNDYEKPSEASEFSQQVTRLLNTLRGW